MLYAQSNSSTTARYKLKSRKTASLTPSKFGTAKATLPDSGAALSQGGVLDESQSLALTELQARVDTLAQGQKDSFETLSVRLNAVEHSSCWLPGGFSLLEKGCLVFG